MKQHFNNGNFAERFILPARQHHIELAQCNSFARITFSLLLGAGYVASLPSLPRICCVAPEMRSSIATSGFDNLGARWTRRERKK